MLNGLDLEAVRIRSASGFHDTEPSSKRMRKQASEASIHRAYKPGGRAFLSARGIKDGPAIHIPIIEIIREELEKSLKHLSSPSERQV